MSSGISTCVSLSHTSKQALTHQSGRTHARSHTCVPSVCTHTQLQRTVGAEKSRRLMGSYGRWQSVLHAQTNGVWQLPLRKTWGCFLFLPAFFPLFFFITAWLTVSVFLPNIHCLPLFCSVSPQMTSHPWRTTCFPFFPSILSLSSSLFRTSSPSTFSVPFQAFLPSR